MYYHDVNFSEAFDFGLHPLWQVCISMFKFHKKTAALSGCNIFVMRKTLPVVLKLGEQTLIVKNTDSDK